MSTLGEIVEIEGEHFRFHVGSRVKGRKAYLVDLEEYRWNGACSCEHFEYRMRPLLEQGAFPSKDLRCWHIEHARDKLLRSLLPQIAKTINEKRKTKNEQTSHMVQSLPKAND